MGNPKVTAVISHWNDQAYLQDAIASLSNQTVLPYEIIIVDDGSDSLPDCTTLRSVSPVQITIVYKPHHGIGSTLNTAIKLMRGDVFCWLPADDLWKPEKLARQQEFALTNPGGGYNSCVLHSFCEVWQDSKFVRVGEVPNLTDKEMVIKIRKAAPYYANTFWIPRGILNKVGSFREDVPACEDYEWVLRSVILHRVKYRLQPEPLTVKRHHNESTAVRQANKIASLVRQFNEEIK